MKLSIRSLRSGGLAAVAFSAISTMALADGTSAGASDASLQPVPITILKSSPNTAPGFIFLTLGGVLYGQHHDHPIVNAMLKGVAAAAVGLIGATWYSIGKKTVHGFYDAFFILAAVLCIHRFGLSVPVTLLAVGALAIFAYRPRQPEEESKSDATWIRSLR